MPPKFPKGNVRLMTDEDKQMNIYNGKAVSICQMRKKKLQCERDGVPFEM